MTGVMGVGLCCTLTISPCKRVTTRARSTVKKLNNHIAEHCRFYARCQSSLMILGAEPAILSHFKVLNPVDVVGSTDRKSTRLNSSH